jgi:peroxiredoxin
MKRHYLFITLLFGLAFRSESRGQESFSLTDLNGAHREFRLPKNSGYRVVVILLSDCPACQSYSKTLNELSRKYSESGIDFTGVFPGTFNTLEEAREFRKSYRIAFDLVSDPQKSLVGSLKATVAPEVFLLDHKGRTIYSGRIDDWMYAVGKKRAVITRHDLKSAIDQALAGKAPDPSQTVPIGCIIE